MPNRTTDTEITSVATTKPPSTQGKKPSALQQRVRKAPEDFEFGTLLTGVVQSSNENSGQDAAVVLVAAKPAPDSPPNTQAVVAFGTRRRSFRPEPCAAKRGFGDPNTRGPPRAPNYSGVPSGSRSCLNRGWRRRSIIANFAACLDSCVRLPGQYSPGTLDRTYWNLLPPSDRGFQELVWFERGAYWYRWREHASQRSRFARWDGFHNSRTRIPL